MDDRKRWDARWERAQSLGTPDPLFEAALSRLAPGGRALDLAAGLGRHALRLAELGFEVEAWDVSGVALRRLALEAHTRGLCIKTAEVDLAARLFPSVSVDLVVIVDFLDRGLFQKLSDLLVAGGHALIVTFNEHWPEAHPSPRFRLHAGELDDGLPGLSTEWVRHAGGRSAWLGQKR